MSNDVTNKPSLSVDTLLPLLDTDNFQTFLQAYYEWMESTRITYVNASGTFVVGDVITGQTSNSKGQIKHVGDGFIVLKMSTKTSFDIAELIQNASSVTATVSKSEDNVLRKADRLIENKSFDEGSGQYFEYLKSELNRGHSHYYRIRQKVGRQENQRLLLCEKYRRCLSIFFQSGI